MGQRLGQVLISTVIVLIVKKYKPSHQGQQQIIRSLAAILWIFKLFVEPIHMEVVWVWSEVVK